MLIRSGIITIVSTALMLFVNCFELSPTHPGGTTGASGKGYFSFLAPTLNQAIPKDTASFSIRYIKTAAVTGTNSVAIYLYKADTLYRTLTTSSYPASTTNSTSYYTWNVSSYSTLPAATNYRIRIVSNADTTQNDFGPYFRITSNITGTFAITAPRGDTSLMVANSAYIRWTSTGSPGTYVRLRLFKDSVYQQTITSSATRSTQSYSWAVTAPGGTSSRYRIKISSVSDTTIAAFSEYFTINSPYYGSYRVLSPDSNSTWAGGTLYTIAWTDSGYPGSYASLKLYNGADSVWLINSMESDTFYSWTVPAGILSSSNYRIKVSSYYDPSISAFSDTFAIGGLVADQYEPDNRRSTAKTIAYGASQQRTLTVNDTDYIKFSADSGKSYFMRVTGGTSVPYIYIFRDSLTSYTTYLSTYTTWACSKSGTYYAQALYSSGDYGEYSFYVANLDSTALVQFTAPTGDTVWTAGSRTITWNVDTMAFSDYVYLYLYDAAVNRTIPLLSSYTANDGSSTVTIPAGLPSGNRYRIKIVDQYSSALYAYSQPFSISGIIVDQYENDDSAGTSSTLTPGGAAQNRSVYYYSTTSGSYMDYDYIKIPVLKDSTYSLKIKSEDPYLYASLYKTLDSARGGSYFSSTTVAVNDSLTIFFTASANGATYLRIYPSTSYPLTTGSYTVNVATLDPSGLVAFSNPTELSTWSAGSSYAIGWTPATQYFGAYVRLSLCYDSTTIHTFTTSTSNSGAYTISLPAGLASAARYRIKMTGTSTYASVYAYSQPFTIGGSTPDAYEFDGTRDSARTIAATGTAQSRNLTYHDTDWVRFSVAAGQVYTIQQTGSMYTNLRLYNDSSTVELASDYGVSYSRNAYLAVYAAVADTYMLQVASSSSGDYSLAVTAFDSAACRLSVYKPAAAEVRSKALPDSVKWTNPTSIGGTVDVFLYRESVGIITSIASGVANTGSIRWQIAPTITNANDYYIKIQHLSVPRVWGRSEVFTIGD